MCDLTIDIPGRYQLMKPMIGKSIDQSMTIDALSVNWHRPIDEQSIITQKWSQLIDCHQLALKKSWYPTRSSLYVYALAVRTNV